MTGAETRTFDVAIIGGGPAGTAAALTLAKYTARRVLIIERGTYETWRPGDALPPGLATQLQFLGAEDVLERGGHLVSHGTAAAWGSPHLVARDFLFTGRGPGWHLDRQRFDKALSACATARGVTVWTGAYVTREIRSDSEWHLTIRRDIGDTTVVTAPFVIDAGGRRSAFARRRGATRLIDDQLFGVTATYSLPDDREIDTFAVVETTPFGWWYSARLPDRRLSVAFMTDAAIVRSRRLRVRDAWDADLLATTHTRARLAGAVLGGAIGVWPAFSQSLEPLGAEGWIAAGDAAVSFDPLSSMGIGYAMSSGVQAARIADAALTAGHTSIEAYDRDLSAHYETYWQRRCEYYEMERRWPDSPFWQRRLAGD